MTKMTLSDKFIQSPKRVPSSGRVDFHDALAPGLALRVTNTGHRSFVLIARYPTSPKGNPTRRALGDYGAVTLEDARKKARGWLELIQKGVDPRVAEARQRAEETRKQTNTFAAVAAEFLDTAASKLAKAAEARHTIEKEFVKRWGARPVTDILPAEVATAIKAIVKRGAPYQAHHAFGYLRRMYRWAIGTCEFGVTSSPLALLRPDDLIGRREVRNRVMSDDELRTIWQAGAWTYSEPRKPQARLRVAADAPELGFPYGPLVRMLILTGQRKREVGDMTWSEIDFNKALWTIPAERMKGKRTQVVPLAPEALVLLKSLPRFSGGDYVFTTTMGAKPVNGFGKLKGRLDKLCGVQKWVFHDLRRTMRTHLSALPVQDLVRELVIAHAKPGLHRVYDLHAYEAEKRECLTLWEQRLRGILAPKPPAEVADLAEARSARLAAQ